MSASVRAAEHVAVGAWPEDGGRLSDLLRRQARQFGSERACVLLDRAGREVATITYGELDRRARALAADMLRTVAPGERALLAFPPTVDFLVAFFGCAYSGIIAVPVPAAGEVVSGVAARLTSIVEDAAPSLVLTTPEIAARPADYGLGATRPIVVSWVPEEHASQFRDPGVGQGSLVLLQYTSGSTSAPKGVQLTHRNVVANLVDMYSTMGLPVASDNRLRIVSWLPLFHDMGLLQVTLPVLTGGLVVLMSPMTFLLRPMLWLEAVARYRAHLVTAPNFAYDLCVSRSTAAERRELDLSGWHYALNGSEPVRAETLDRFSHAFADAGFDPGAFTPCYGLAEATVYVSGARGASARVTASATALARDLIIRPPEGDEPAREVMSCGPVGRALDLRIVDQASGRECLPGHVGEIWLAGDCISRGYWRRADERFSGRLADKQAGPYLRTHDLGFCIDGQLYVLSRSDDVIILDGQNHFPQDIELTAQLSHPAIAAGRVAAFGYPHPRTRRTAVAVAVETARRIRVAAPGSAAGPSQLDGAEIVKAVRAAVWAGHQIQVAEVVLLHPAALPRTTSGKVQRRRCLEGFLAGTLKTWRDTRPRDER